VITSVIMAVVGVLACAAPARRALRVQPTEALRQIWTWSFAIFRAPPVLVCHLACCVPEISGHTPSPPDGSKWRGHVRDRSRHPARRRQSQSGFENQEIPAGTDIRDSTLNLRRDANFRLP
jgi:hypothetical protein